MKKRVLVVDDSAFMRRIITDILKEDNRFEVIETAKNGKEALSKIKSLKPDVITLDVEMPILNGIETLKEIMSNYKTPVVMLSSLTQDGAEATMEALELGAVDFIAKPSSIFEMDSKKEELLEKIEAATKATIHKKPTTAVKRRKNNIKTLKKGEKRFSTLIGIGTSTGGPRALQEIIPFFPADINASIVIVQHMPPGFTKSLAKRLDSLSEVKVKEAEADEVLKRGYCYIAPGNYHVLIKEKFNELRIELNDGENVSGHKPSVDVLMNSISHIKKYKTIGAILTGMGSDGTKGIQKVNDNGGFTVAQDEESSVIFGMPKAAINSGAIDKIIALNNMAKYLTDKVGV